MEERPERVELDVRGQICPSTLLTTLRELNRNRDSLRRGDMELVVLTDNRSATGTIPEAAENMGYRVQVEKDGAHYVISVRNAKD